MIWEVLVSTIQEGMRRYCFQPGNEHLFEVLKGAYVTNLDELRDALLNVIIKRGYK